MKNTKQNKKKILRIMQQNKDEVTNIHQDQQKIFFFLNIHFILRSRYLHHVLKAREKFFS